MAYVVKAIGQPVKAIGRPVMLDESSPAGTSAVISMDKYSAPQVPRMCSASFCWRRPILPVSLPLPRFSTQNVASDIGQSSQRYPLSPGSRSSTPCLDMAAFDSECSGSATMGSPVSAVVVDRGVVNSPELGEVVALGMSTITSRFSPLNPQQSPVSMLSVPQVVVKSATSYEAPMGSNDVCLAADWVLPLLHQESQVSQLSSVQLSPNRVREDYDFDAMDVFPVFPVSPRNN